jgi:glucuronokinase
MIITRRGYARAGLIGNPSDGYFGKTISIIVKNFHAEISLFQTPEL